MTVDGLLRLISVDGGERINAFIFEDMLVVASCLEIREYVENNKNRQCDRMRIHKFLLDILQVADTDELESVIEDHTALKKTRAFIAVLHQERRQKNSQNGSN